MHQTLVSPPSRPTARRRRRHRTARLTAAALLALTALSAAPRPAEAISTPESYKQCIDAVYDWYERCASGKGPIGDFACMWAGGVGIIGCAVLEAIEQLGRGVVLPRPM